MTTDAGGQLAMAANGGSPINDATGRPDQARPGPTRPDKARPGQTRPDQTRPEHPSL